MLFVEVEVEIVVVVVMEVEMVVVVVVEVKRWSHTPQNGEPYGPWRRLLLPLPLRACPLADPLCATLTDPLALVDTG
ncbi:hypothetical protein E2C01_073452 [Portunus trituberculatus]|uniref:Uncharacterized protein n=1 Tax=Portunus trituberculatus TaxID=210409 RepID=A0A5B7I9H0_PORTR|nr:hypothetical protein [Portunus trituberculatus]